MRRIAWLFGALAVTLTATLGLFGSSTALAAATPVVSTGASSAIMPTTATVSGTVDLNGASLAPLDLSGSCYFEYGTTTSYGSMSTCPTSPAATGTTAEAANLTGLTAGTTYHYQLVVVTGGLLGLGSTPTGGGDQSFATPAATVPPTAVTTTATTVGSASVTLNGTVNPENWAISACTFSYTPSGGSAATVPCASIPTGATAQSVSGAVGSGLTAGTAYSYTLAVTYDNGMTVTSSPAGSFTTMSASVAAPTALGATTATLTGTVNPEGQTITACTFYYGTSATTLQTVPCSTAASQITGTSNLGVSAAVTGLTQGTAYVDTVVITTSDNALGVAAPATFTTLTAPKAVTTAATAISTTTATLHATVNAGGQTVRACGFEWGVNPLTTSTTGSDLALVEPCDTTPAATGNQTTSVTLKGLAPGTTYYFRVLVVTYGGDAIANTVSFKTLAASTAKPTVTISATAVNAKARTAKFKFARTGKTLVTKGFQCALVTVTKGKAGTPRYTACKSIRTYTKLKKSTTYIFYLRGVNAIGPGRTVSHRFVG
jgi:hypothetical protein